MPNLLPGHRLAIARNFLPLSLDLFLFKCLLLRLALLLLLPRRLSGQEERWKRGSVLSFLLVDLLRRLLSLRQGEEQKEEEEEEFNRSRLPLLLSIRRVLVALECMQSRRKRRRDVEGLLWGEGGGVLSGARGGARGAGKEGKQRLEVSNIERRVSIDGRPRCIEGCPSCYEYE